MFNSLYLYSIFSQPKEELNNKVDVLHIYFFSIKNAKIKHLIETRKLLPKKQIFHKTVDVFKVLLLKKEN